MTADLGIGTLAAMLNAAESVSVLLIDDDDLSREILELLLGGEGYEVVAAGSGEEALALLRSGLEVDVIVSDLKMPGLAGADLGTALRAACARAPRALLAMSGSEPAHGAIVGYDGFLPKPFPMEQFDAAIRRAESPAGQDTGSEPRREVDAQSSAVLDEAKLLKLQVSFTPAQLDELFRFALTDAERQIEMMQLAATGEDDGLYRRCAHSMKGSFGMLGAPELQGMAAEAEESGSGDLETEVTTRKLFLGALTQLRHTLMSRGICHG